MKRSLRWPRDGPGGEVSGVTLGDSSALDAILEPLYCQPERKPQ